MAMTMVSDLPPAYCTLNESTVKLNDDEVPGVVVPTTDNEEETLYGSSFDDRNSRIAFIQKVLSITLLELSAVLIVMIGFIVNSSFRYTLQYQYNFPNYILCSTLGYVFILGLLIHSTEARWKKPFNYIFLVLYPVSFGIFISIAGYYILDGIFIAWAYFCVVILALLLYSVFALQSKLEFTVRTGFCITVGLLIVLYLLTVPTFYLSTFRVLYPTMVVFFLCSYILCDLEAMVEKHYRFVVTPADFVMGALIIHIDYFYIFKKWYKAIKAKYSKVLSQLG